MGYRPESIDPDAADEALTRLADERRCAPLPGRADGASALAYDPESDLTFNYEKPLPGHANGMTFVAIDDDGNSVLERTYYSIGGGFVMNEAELDAGLDAIWAAMCGCIERNGFGAVKAVTASSLALRGDGAHHISLDRCVETMRLTGLDLSDKYKETSQGGLAVTHPAC